MSENKDKNNEFENENIVETDEVSTEDSDVKNEETTVENSDSHDESQYEKVCYVCRRPESKCGKLFDLPGNVTVCEDCLQPRGYRRHTPSDDSRSPRPPPSDSAPPTDTRW